MRKTVLLTVALFVSISLTSHSVLQAQSAAASAVVFSEPGFPAADSAAPSPQQVVAILPGAQTANIDRLAIALAVLDNGHFHDSPHSGSVIVNAAP